MALPSTIRACADPAIIGTVTRLYNGSLTDIANELLQNARRGQASVVSISYNHERRSITFSDDGHGIANPRALLSLGASAWGGNVSEEDPAGMGFFSAAGLQVRIKSCGTYPGTSKPFAWAATIGADDWTGEHDIPVETDETAVYGILPGTSIEIILADETRFPFLRGGLSEDSETRDTAAAIQRILTPCTRYYPLPVHFGADSMDCQQDFLKDCLAVHDFGAYRIGVRRQHRSWGEAQVNFYGLTAQAKLPQISEVHGDQWACKVEIANSADLQLVLPARKELVQNADYYQLEYDCLTAIYRTINGLVEMSTDRGHSLSYDHWREAASLGVELPPADAKLVPWAPADTSGNRIISAREAINPATAVIIEGTDAAEDRALALAINEARRDKPDLINHTFFLPQDKFRGYAWYDAVPCYHLASIDVTPNAGEQPVDIADRPGRDEAHKTRISAITAQDRVVQAINLRLVDSSGQLPDLDLPTPAFIVDEGYNWDEATILLTENHGFTGNGFAAFATNSAFNPWEDPDADSHHTQLERFQEEAIGRFLTLTANSDAALCHQIEQALGHIAWNLPENTIATVTIARQGREKPNIQIKLRPTSKTAPDCSRHIELSTGHLTDEIANILDTLQDTVENRELTRAAHGDWRDGLVVCPYRYGFWVRRFLDLKITADIPECLQACFALAEANGATWILFGRDADTVDDIPHYENW